MEKLQEIELTIKDVNEDGVFAISLVENPAIEENWVHLSSHQIDLKVVDEEKRIVVGYALVPDKRIYRNQNGKEFNIFFSADTIRQTAELYMKQLNNNNVTTEHETKIEGASVIESWITESEKFDKVNLYNLKPIVGGWAVMMKIYNDEAWKSVKDGTFKGYSIEGKYDGFEQLQSKQVNNIEMNNIEEIKKIIQEGLNLKSESVELSLINDIEKILDANLGKQRQLIAQGLKISEGLLALTVDYQKALSMAIDAANKAKELGITDAEKLFRVRGEEARDYKDIVGKVSSQIATSLRLI